MAYSDPDPTVIGRKIFLVTLVASIVFASAAYLIVS
jgi:hypothetical protein